MLREHKFTPAEKWLLRGLAPEEYLIMVLLFHSNTPLSATALRRHALKQLKINLTKSETLSLLKQLRKRGRVRLADGSRTAFEPVRAVPSAAKEHAGKERTA